MSVNKVLTESKAGKALRYHDRWKTLSQSITWSYMVTDYANVHEPYTNTPVLQTQTREKISYYYV